MKEVLLRYRNLFQEVRNILNQYDSESLQPGYSSGSPMNEYDLESSKITSVLLKKQNLSKDEMFDELNKIWIECFEKDCSKSKEISEELIKLFNSK